MIFNSILQNVRMMLASAYVRQRMEFPSLGYILMAAVNPNAPGAPRRQPPAPRPMPPPPPSFSGAAAIHTALAVSRVRSTRNPISNCFTERSSQVRSVAKASV